MWRGGVQPSPRVVRIVIVLSMLLWHREICLLTCASEWSRVPCRPNGEAREGNVPTQYDHREGSEGLERHIRRSERFFFSRRLLILRRGAAYQQSGPTTSDMAERFTGPSRECMEWLGEMGPSADNVYSCFTGCTSRALESGALPLTSASSRGLQSLCESASRRYNL